MNALKDYIESGFTTSETFMSVSRGGIRYIYEAPPEITLSGNRCPAELIGIYARGIFYYVFDKYQNVGKSYEREFLSFVQLYNDMFDKQMKQYSARKPIGGKIPLMLQQRLDKFRENDIERVALDLIFGADAASEKPVDRSYFEPLFLRYLLLGNKSLDGAVKADISEHADELNFTMMSENMAYKRVAELLRDEKMPEKIAIYGKVRQSNSIVFTIAINFEGIVINNIDIEKAQLMRMIKYGESFMYKRRLVINFEDISEITSEKQVIYSK